METQIPDLLLACLTNTTPTITISIFQENKCRLIVEIIITTLSKSPISAKVLGANDILDAFRKAVEEGKIENIVHFTYILIKTLIGISKQLHLKELGSELLAVLPRFDIFFSFTQGYDVLLDILFFFISNTENTEKYFVTWWEQYFLHSSATSEIFDAQANFLDSILIVLKNITSKHETTSSPPNLDLANKLLAVFLKSSIFIEKLATYALEFEMFDRSANNLSKLAFTKNVVELVAILGNFKNDYQQIIIDFLCGSKYLPSLIKNFSQLENKEISLVTLHLIQKLFIFSPLKEDFHLPVMEPLFDFYSENHFPLAYSIIISIFTDIYLKYPDCAITIQFSKKYFPLILRKLASFPDYSVEAWSKMGNHDKVPPTDRYLFVAHFGHFLRMLPATQLNFTAGSTLAEIVNRKLPPHFDGTYLDRISRIQNNLGHK